MEMGPRAIPDAVQGPDAGAGFDTIDGTARMRRVRPTFRARRGESRGRKAEAPPRGRGATQASAVSGRDRERALPTKEVSREAFL